MTEVINGYIERTKNLLYYGDIDRLSTPLEIYLEMTNRCNMNCVYCYKRHLNGGNPQFFKMDLLERVLEDISIVSANPVLFVLEGGEPLLHPEFLLFLETIKLAKHPIDILTNGELLTRTMIGRIARLLDDNIDEIQISLDSISNISNSNRRNDFNKVINNILLLNAEGILPRLNCVITKYNINHIPDYLEHVDKHLKIKSLSLNAVMGLSNKELRAERKDLVHLSSIIEQNDYSFALCESYLHRMYEDGSVCSMMLKNNNFYRRCTALTGKLCVSTTGDVYPCVFYENIMPPIGNLYNQTIEEIWLSSSAKSFLKRKNDQLMECSNCNSNQNCTQICAGSLL